MHIHGVNFRNNSELEEKKNQNQRQLNCCCQALTATYSNTDLFSLFFHLLFLCFDPFPTSLRFSFFISLDIHTPLQSKRPVTNKNKYGRDAINSQSWLNRCLDWRKTHHVIFAVHCDLHVIKTCTERKPRETLRISC